MAFVDVKKAFDSVCHQSILVAATCLRVPMPFLGYIRELYSDVMTTLRIGLELSSGPITLGRDVRQGDPLSWTAQGQSWRICGRHCFLRNNPPGAAVTR